MGKLTQTQFAQQRVLSVIQTGEVLFCSFQGNERSSDNISTYNGNVSKATHARISRLAHCQYNFNDIARIVKIRMLFSDSLLTSIIISLATHKEDLWYISALYYNYVLMQSMPQLSLLHILILMHCIQRIQEHPQLSTQF